jgi:serine/threonine-protein kinase
LLLGIGVIVYGRIAEYQTRKALDPNLVAVAPFDVLDSRFDLWHEGLVDYLSKSLDGAGSLRTTSPTVVLRYWRGPADPLSASELGHRTGAGLVVFGQVVGVGSDSVRLRITVLDAATRKTLAEPERTDLADRIARLADSLTTDVLRDLGRIGSEGYVRLASVTTKSLPALKAFLRGEQLLRRFSLDSAMGEYEKAVEDDGGFALALRRIGMVRGWKGESGGSFALRAGRFNHGLAVRDSLLIVADSLEAASDDSLDHAYWSHRVRKVATLEATARRYADDPEVWYELGEARFHLGFVVGATAQQTMDAFNHAIALDTAFAPAYVHPVQLSLDQNDITAAKRYVDGYRGLTSAVSEGAGIRLVAALLDSTRTRPLALQRVLDSASTNVLYDAWRSVQRWPDADEAGVRLLRLLATGRRGTGVSGDTAWARYLLATQLVYRGHLREARAMVGPRFNAPFAELAAMGVVSADSAGAAFERWLRSPDERSAGADPPWVARCYRSFLAAGWWARRQDTAPLFHLMHRGESVARVARSVVEIVDARADERLAWAALALARSDTEEALRRFLAFPDSLCTGLYGSLSPSLAPLNAVRFQLLAAKRRDREAALVFDRQVTLPLTAGSVIATLERGRVAERLGDRATAAQKYRLIVDVWRNADPELQPYVAEARSALKRLAGGPR